MVVLHVGTNDIQHKEPKELADDMKSLCQGIVTKNPTCEIAISEIVKRQDLVLNTKIHETNKLLSNLCEESNWYFIKHSNIDTKHLNRSGLHLNRQGIAILAKNLYRIS
jgi:lysophospholipase L1-like esterase